MLLFAIAAFSSAFLLFQVQPILARFILPWFGGGPGVWTACLIFFQVTLLAGYAYAHALTRLGKRTQWIVHLALLLVATALLPIIPSPAWKPGAADPPMMRILALLAATVGIQAFTLASTGPLLQRWFTGIGGGRSPYRLYAWSNLGSLLGLLTYPFLIEPSLKRTTQAGSWSVLFAGFAILCAVCAFRFNRDADESETVLKEKDAAPPSVGVRALWLLLPTCASVLLLAVTNQLCLDVAVIPFLWVLPLSVYLISFILTFESSRWYSRPVFLCLVQLGMAAEAWLLHRVENKEASIALQIGIHCGVLFVCCMACHGELARWKPAPNRLTSFYLTIAAGGALGGIFVGIVAPLIFRDLFELHFGLVACLVLVLVSLAMDRDWFLYRFRPFWAWIPIVVLVTLLSAVLWKRAVAVVGRAIEVSRNFYGVLAVTEYDPRVPVARRLVLTHGNTLHGVQFFEPEKRRWPTSYYGPESGVGLAIRHLQERGPVRVGAVGLGVGTVAAYGRSGDYFRFYEINPEVARIAKSRFSYLSDDPGQVEIALGDARVSLEREEPQRFDVIILDAFSSDAVPVHLLTREALEVYLRHLAPDGVLAFHITTAYLDLRSVVNGLAEHFEMPHVLVIDERRTRKAQGAALEDALRGVETSLWVLVTRNRAILEAEDVKRGANIPQTKTKPSRLWTDDESNILSLVWTR